MSRVTITVDRVPELLAALDALTKQQVLIGIPGDGEQREGEVSNAMLGYVHEYGSPEQNIPARPFLRPAAEQVKDQVIGLFQQAASAVMDGKPDAANKALNAAGQLGVNKVKAIMNAGEGFTPLTESAMQSRLYRAMKGKGLVRTNNLENWQKAKEKLLKNRGRYSLGGATPLVDTGQFRNSITYVVRDK